MTYNPKLKSCKSFKPQEGKSSWALALGDLVKKTKRNLEGIDSSASISNIIHDGTNLNRDERLFQKTNAYKLLGIGRSSSSFGSRNSAGNFISNKLNTNSIESNASSKVQVTASFEDDQNLNINSKKYDILQQNHFLPQKELPPKIPETFGIKNNPSSSSLLSQTHQFDKRSVAHEFSQEISILK